MSSPKKLLLLINIIIIINYGCTVNGDIKTGGGGYALMFTGQQTDKLRLQLQENTLNEITISMWMKYSHPGSDATIDFNGYYGCVLSYLSFADDIQLKLCLYDSHTIRIKAQTAYFFPLTDSTTWNHLLFSWNGNIGTFNAYWNIGNKNASLTDYYNYTMESDGDPFYMKKLSSLGYFLIGGSTLASDAGFHGSLDNVCMWNESLSLEQAKNVYINGCDNEKRNLLYYLTFDDDDLDRSFQIKNSVNNKYIGLIGDVLYDIKLNFGSDSGLPLHTYSTAPIIGSKMVIVSENIIINKTIHIKLNCDYCDQFVITSLPSNGKLYQFGSNQSISSINEIVYDSSHKLSYILKNNATKPMKEIDSFNYKAINTTTSEYTNGTVKIVQNTPSVILNTNYDLDQNSYDVLYLPQESGSYDIDGDDSVVYITSIIMNIQGLYIYQFDSNLQNISSDGSTISTQAMLIASYDQAINESNPILVTDPYKRLLIIHNSNNYGQNYSLITYKLFDGYQLSDSAITNINILSVNNIPIAENIEEMLDEDNSLCFPLNISDSENDIIYTIISTLPSHGSLYQKNIDDIISPIALTSSSELVNQWAQSAIASSYWDAIGTSPFQMTGEPDVYPKHGDFDGEWQPSDEGDFRHQWIQIKIKESVYIDTVEVYETWHVGGVVKIEAINDLTNKSEIVYEGESKILELNPDPTQTTSLISSYYVCPTIYPSSTVRIYFELPNYDYWLAVDAVQIIGYAQIDGNVVSSRNSTICYTPNNNYDGTDKFTYVVNDCPYYTISRNLYESKRTAEINLRIKQINDKPNAVSFHYEIFDGASSNIFGVFIKLITSDNDDKYNNLTFEISQLPKGNLYQVNSYPHDYKNINFTTITKNDKNKFDYELLQSVPYKMQTNYLLYQPKKCSTPAKQSYPSNLLFNIYDPLTLKFNDPQNSSITFEVICETQLYEPLESVQLAVFALGIFELVMLSVFYIYLYYHRSSKVINHASPLFCYLIVFFLQILAISSILYSIQEKHSIICNMRVWMLGIGCVGGLSCILVKTYRISRLFNNPMLKRIILSDYLLIVYALILIMIELSMLLCNLLLKLAIVKIKSGKGNFQSYLIDYCTENTIWVAFHDLWISLLVVIATNVAWHVRKAPKTFNEAYYIALSMMIISFIGTISISLQYLLISDPNVLMLIRGFGISLSVLTVFGCIFGTKIYFIHYDTQEPQNLNPSTRSSNSTQTQTDPQILSKHTHPISTDNTILKAPAHDFTQISPSFTNIKSVKKSLQLSKSTSPATDTSIRDETPITTIEPNENNKEICNTGRAYTN